MVRSRSMTTNVGSLKDLKEARLKKKLIRFQGNSILRE